MVVMMHKDNNLKSVLELVKFALCVHVSVSAVFGFVMGQSPNGYHAWNIFRTDDGLLQIEPQTGVCFPMCEKGYKAEYILL